ILKYNGGGDWYANPTSVPNLVKFCNTKLKTNVNTTVDEVSVSSPEIFNYPFIHMTGHGNVVFGDADVDNLRKYLLAGGFLHIDDNYGMDKFVRNEIKKVFPDQELVELPFTHPIYNQTYKFPKGLPKIHEHDNKAAQGFAIIKDGRVLIFYSYETDLGDGWEDQDVHNDSPELREKALQMGSNIVQFALMNN
ncbi:MAG: DUF4159 domain-containing protein, partial [Flavobacteriales bacterium]